ncbi:hypothetical protein F5Y17DRAFT_454506 [Xylariaceae sp. FL0594]|nr:hypothetical protein F5Y17DRAFT_454506 [Xylariaceae sp. FL0594]
MAITGTATGTGEGRTIKERKNCENTRRETPENEDQPLVLLKRSALLGGPTTIDETHPTSKTSLFLFLKNSALLRGTTTINEVQDLWHRLNTRSRTKDTLSYNTSVTELENQTQRGCHQPVRKGRNAKTRVARHPKTKAASLQVAGGMATVLFAFADDAGHQGCSRTHGNNGHGTNGSGVELDVTSMLDDVETDSLRPRHHIVGPSRHTPDPTKRSAFHFGGECRGEPSFFL